MARVLLAALLVLLPSIGLSAQAGDREEKAMRELDRAKDLARRGGFSAARAVYKKVAVKYAGTAAAIVAQMRIQPNCFLGWAFLVENGPRRNRVDVVAMGDGYTLAQQNSLANFAKSVPKVFEKHKLLGEYYTYHNFIRASVVSKEAGVDGFGREYDTALDARVIGTVQGHVAVSWARVQKMLAELGEHDGLAVVFVKRGSHGTGGGGVATIGGRDDDTLVHEWGHAFAGLADEYDTHTGARGPVRSTFNLSGTADRKTVPWRHFLEARVPGVGVYRGGGGRLKGAWKPTNHCTMSSGVIFCPVCREQLVLRIYSLVDPIDGCQPTAHPTRGEVARELLPDRRGGYDFQVEIMRPATHGLEVRWWVLPEQEVPPPVREGPLPDRRRRGKLSEIKRKPVDVVRGSRRRVNKFRFKPPPDASGRYRVVCRVRDRAKPSGQAWPWVLKDPAGILESERGWWITVGQ